MQPGSVRHTMRFASETPNARPIHIIKPSDLDGFISELSAFEANWVQQSGFTARLGETLLVPNQNGEIALALVGWGNASQRERQRFILAHARNRLPRGIYCLAPHSLSKEELEREALGWLLEAYLFDLKSKPKDHKHTELVAPEGIDARFVELLASAEALSRDLINMPANLLGPDELEQAARNIAEDHKAELRTIIGNELLEANFPLIHAVGRASQSAPRLIEISAGDTGPKVTLVGKGVCFDTGGLNIKPARAMGLMKKDMGGAATVLGLTQLLLTQKLPCQLRVLLPVVENSISGNAFRPGDVLTSRSGKTVEINNTDAEGRVILADALSYACEDEPDLLISFATLTGAARVALGPELPPVYLSDRSLMEPLARAGKNFADPLWEMPFWPSYEQMIEPSFGDLDNAPEGGMAGSITAALFLKRFTENARRYMHLDIYGWQPRTQPGLSKGGLGQGARAVYGMLNEMLENHSQ